MKKTNHVKHSVYKARVEIRPHEPVGEHVGNPKWKREVVTANTIPTLLEKIRVLGIRFSIRQREYFYRTDKLEVKEGNIPLLVDSKLINRKPKSQAVGNFVMTTVRYNNKDYRLEELDGSEYLHGDSHGMLGHKRIYTLRDL